MKPPARLRVIHGALTGPDSMASKISPTRAAARVVQAAQALYAAVLDAGVLEKIDLSTDAGRVFLAFMDSVDEYEYRSASFPLEAQDPATTS